MQNKKIKTNEMRGEEDANVTFALTIFIKSSIINLTVYVS